MSEPTRFGKYSKTIREMQQAIDFLAKFTEEEVGRKQQEIDLLKEALTEIAAMDPKGIRADDLGRAARIASKVVAALPPDPVRRSASRILSGEFDPPTQQES